MFLLTITIITYDIREEKDRFCVIRSLLAVIVLVRKQILKNINIYISKTVKSYSELSCTFLLFSK